MTGAASCWACDPDCIKDPNVARYRGESECMESGRHQTLA